MSWVLSGRIINLRGDWSIGRCPDELVHMNQDPVPTLGPSGKPDVFEIHDLAKRIPLGRTLW